MEEARAVLDRLGRIESLERRGAPPQLVLAEVRALLHEAERWARREGSGVDAAEAALERCGQALAERSMPVTVS